MLKAIKRIFILALFSYSGAVTYMAIEGINPLRFADNYLETDANSAPLNVAAEYQFIIRLFDDYFLIDRSASQRQKRQAIENKISHKISGNFMNNFTETIGLYVDGKAERSYNLIKILRDKKKVNGYTVLVEVKSKFPKEPKQNFLMHVDLLIKSYRGQGKTNYKIVEWKERIAPAVPKQFSKPEVLIGQSGDTEITLPCDFESVAPIKNHKAVDLNLDAKNRLIRFKPKDDISGIAKFRASCRDRIYNLDLLADEQYQTVFHAFNVRDGIAKKRRLTRREKLIRTLESHMNVKVVK